jgi:signal recognition particle subunit SEC65
MAGGVAGRKWVSPEEQCRIRALVSEGKTAPEIAALLGREAETIRTWARKLGLDLKHGEDPRWPEWKPEELAYIERASRDSHDSGLIGRALNRPRERVTRKAKELGIVLTSPWRTGREVRIALSPKLYAILKERARDLGTTPRRLARVLITAPLRDEWLFGQTIEPNLLDD